MKSFRPFSALATARWAIAVLLFLPVAADAQFTPAVGSPFPAGARPNSVVAADFNEDGIMDFAVADFSGGNVSILLGSPDGGYAPAPLSPLAVGSDPVSLAVFSLNQHACIAVANQGDDTVTLLLGDGTGAFTKLTLKVGSEPVSVAAAQFGATVWLAIANFGDNNVSVLTGGTGVFNQAPGSPFPVGKDPSSVVIADFNSDGQADLAIANKFDSTVTVLLGNANGGFAQPAGSPFAVIPLTAHVPPTAYPASLAVADFNGDGNLDLAVANEGTNNIAVLLGNGAGSFAAVPNTTATPVGSAPLSLVAGYFNADLLPDLAVASDGDNTVTVLFGNGASGFEQSAFNPFTADPNGPYPVGAEPVSITSADFNSDGKTDLAVANSGGNDVTILINSTPGPVTVSAASYKGQSVGIGSLISIFGTNLGTSGSLSETGVTIIYSNGTQDILTLLSVSPTQIDAIVPQSAVAGAATITVSTAGSSQSGPLTVVGVAPGLFSANSTGEGVAAAQFAASPTQALTSVAQCATVTGTCVAVPLDVSSGASVLNLFGTGICSNQTPSSVSTSIPVSVSVGSQPLPGNCLSSGDPGVDQISLTIPASEAGSGLTKVSVAACGGSAKCAPGLISNTVTVYFK